MHTEGVSMLVNEAESLLTVHVQAYEYKLMSILSLIFLRIILSVSIIKSVWLTEMTLFTNDPFMSLLVIKSHI